MENTYKPHARWLPLAHTQVRLDGGLWGVRQATNRETSLPHGYHSLQDVGNFHDLRLAAGQIQGDYKGPLFMDSDLHKWLEAVSLELANAPDPRLQQMADETIDLLAAAQGEDGYLNSYYTVVKPHERWHNIKDGHELYCAGHLFEAAVAHHRATGSDRLLNIARRFADYIAAVFGPGKRAATPGHPEIELALIKLYHVTGEQRYLDLAQLFIDQRGHGLLNAPNADYYQDRTPVRDQTRVVGHAVRALYLAAGATDLYMETGEQALLDAMLAQWRDMTSGKLSITGGVGARHEGESFGDPYELPNDRAYNETCAAIASILWNWRLLQVTGESRFADLIERTLYNGFLSGMGVDGRGYFYVNPLLSRGGYDRPHWHWCACCPPNVMRLLASLSGYFVTADQSGLQIHQYAPMSIEAGATRLKVETAYPWNGQVSIVVEQTPADAWTLQLRLPGWCDSATLEVNSQKSPADAAQNGYLRLERRWQAGDRVTLQLPMQPRLTAAHPRIDATRGSLAIEYGPLVYCIEQHDHDFDIMDVAIAPDAALEPAWQPDFLGGALLIKAAGYLMDTASWGDSLYRPANHAEASHRPVQLTAIPYHLWANRDAGAMRVWLPKTGA